MTFTFGRLKEAEDPKNWPIQRLLGVDLIKTPIDKIWPTTEVLDQGQTPACTGFSQAICATCGPLVEKGITNEIGVKIYATAQTLDPWANEPHEGSTVTAAAKAVLKLYPDIYDGYYFCKNMDEVDAALSYVGPVIFGTDWLESMFNVDSNDNVVVDKSSPVAGGHAFTIASINVKTKRRQIDQSWGVSWGRHGKAFFLRDDLAYLLGADGGQALVMKNKHLVTIN